MKKNHTESEINYSSEEIQREKEGKQERENQKRFVDEARSDTIYELFSSTLKKINDFISSELKKDLSPYSDVTKKMIGTSVEGGGKRLRSIISYSIYKIFGGQEKSALQIAYAIELSHSSTLIHDDIIDRPEMRRGQIPIFKVFGEGLSLLAGDLLFSLSFLKIPPTAKDLFSKLMADVIEGQILDVLWSRGDRPENQIEKEKRILEIQAKKTSSLFMISFLVPFVSLSPEGKKIPRNFDKIRKKIYNLLSLLGYNFGLTFQILDDISDFDEDTERGSPNILEVLGKEKTKEVFLKYKNETIKNLSDLEKELENFPFDVKRKYFLLLKYIIYETLNKERDLLK